MVIPVEFKTKIKKRQSWFIKGKETIYEATYKLEKVEVVKK